LLVAEATKAGPRQDARRWTGPRPIRLLAEGTSASRGCTQEPAPARCRLSRPAARGRGQCQSRLKIPQISGVKFPTPSTLRGGSPWPRLERIGVGRAAAPPPSEPDGRIFRIRLPTADESGSPPFFQTVAFSADVDVGRVVQQPVQNRRGDDRVAAAGSPAGADVSRAWRWAGDRDLLGGGRDRPAQGFRGPVWADAGSLAVRTARRARSSVAHSAAQSFAEKIARFRSRSERKASERGINRLRTLPSLQVFDSR